METLEVKPTAEAAKPSPLIAEDMDITLIIVKDRLREDYGEQEQEDLIDSMEQYGLIEPLVINQHNELIAGGRRYAAAQALGWKTVPIVRKETLSMRHLHELEIEENIRRKEMTWQERVKSVARLHYMKAADAALGGKDKWGMRQTGEMLKMSLASVGYALQVAGLLEKNDPEITACEGLTEAIRLMAKRRETELMQELGRRTAPITPAKVLGAIADAATPPADLMDAYTQGDQTTSSNVSSPQVFSSNSPAGTADVVIPLSSFVLRQPDLTMSAVRSLAPESVDHCITDPPYGIDMSNLDQSGTGMGNIDSIAESHGVEQNMELFREMFPAVHRVLKPNGFFVLWCDVMQWQHLYNIAIASGFRVQRWPIIWHKIHACMNQAAQYNFTKNTEMAMVCRKAGATLVQAAPSSVIAASNGEVKRFFGDHPFVKPFELTDFLLKYIAIQGQTILEPFAGRGSIVLPILRHHCRVIAVEYSNEHYPFLVENIKQHYLKINPNTKFT